jgi:chorismate mutase
MPLVKIKPIKKRYKQNFSKILNTPKIIITGPCAAESKEQLFATAKEIYDLRFTIYDLQFFRAGVWKPRTNPNDFQGVGN